MVDFLAAFLGGFMGAGLWWLKGTRHKKLELPDKLEIPHHVYHPARDEFEDIPSGWKAGPIDPGLKKKSITADENALKKDIAREKERFKAGE